MLLVLGQFLPNLDPPTNTMLLQSIYVSFFNLVPTLSIQGWEYIADPQKIADLAMKQVKILLKSAPFSLKMRNSRGIRSKIADFCLYHSQPWFMILFCLRTCTKTPGWICFNLKMAKISFLGITFLFFIKTLSYFQSICILC